MAVDVIWWETLEQARAASERSMTSESCSPMFALIDMESAKLSREGVYRLVLCLTPERFAERFGQPQRRPPKCGVVDLAGYDLSRLGELMPQPVHAWMRWVQILSPSRSTRASSTTCSPPTTNTSGGPRPRPGRRS